MINKVSDGAVLVGALVLDKGVRVFQGAGAPTNGASGTGAGKANKSSVYLDRANAHLYVNKGTQASPTWVRSDDLRVAFVAAPNAAVVDSAFFTADQAYTVVAIDEIHSTAGTDAGAVNVMPRKATGTQSPSAGVALLTGSFDLKGTINTRVAGTLTATSADLDLAAGDRLCADITGVITAVAGVCMTVVLKRK